MTELEIDAQAKIIWNYLRMRQSIKKADAIFVLCSIDDRVAEFGAQLFLAGYGKWLIFSGGTAHQDDLLKTDYAGSEAEHFASIAIKLGVPKNKILIEDQAKNTGQNVKFVNVLLKEKNLHCKSFILVQKPYMERRTFATFKKQWPVPTTKIFVTSPPIQYENYFNVDNTKKQVINIMVGDLQRVLEYPRLGFQIKQPVPAKVLRAYEKLVNAGFDEHLIAK